MRADKIAPLFICCGVSVLSSFAQTPPGILLTNTQIIPKNYITIDLSTAVQGSSSVNLLALDDNTNAAFGFTNAAGTAYQVYTLANGTQTSQSSLLLSQPDSQSSGVVDNLTPSGILSSGTVFGIYSGPISSWNQIIRYPFSAIGNNVTSLGFPQPYLIGPGWQTGTTFISALASDGSYAMSFTYDMASTFHMTLNQNVQPGQYYSYVGAYDLATAIISQNNQRQAFALENAIGVWPVGQYPGAYSGTKINTSQYFTPIAINTNSWGGGCRTCCVSR